MTHLYEGGNRQSNRIQKTTSMPIHNKKNLLKSSPDPVDFFQQTFALCM